MRLLGALIVIAAASYMGLAGAGALRQRGAALRGIEAGLLALRREIGERMTALPEAVALAAESAGPAAAFFTELRARLGEEEITLSDAWQGAMARPERYGLRRGDLEPLAELGGVLGRYSAEGQGLALERAARRVGELAEAAEREAGENARLMTGGGICLGLFTALLLL